MDGIQGAVLNVKLKYLDAWNKERQDLAAYYNNNLGGLPLKIPAVAPYSTHIYHQYVLRVRGDRDGLMRHLQKKGIDARVFYSIALHLQKCFEYLGYKKGDMKEAERAARETLAIPVDPSLNLSERKYIVSTIKEFLNG